MLRFDKPRLLARCAAPACKAGTVDEIFSAENLAQPIEKARFGRENPRISKDIQGNPTAITWCFSGKQALTKKTQTVSGIPSKGSLTE
jgi:hypothetical protein